MKLSSADSAAARASPSPSGVEQCGASVAEKVPAKEEEDDEVKVRSINDCFDTFSASEQLGARMQCDSCAGSVLKTKQMSFCSLPRVMVVHLKRFDAMADRKIDVRALCVIFCTSLKVFSVDDVVVVVIVSGSPGILQ